MLKTEIIHRCPEDVDTSTPDEIKRILSKELNLSKLTNQQFSILFVTLGAISKAFNSVVGDSVLYHIKENGLKDFRIDCKTEKILSEDDPIKNNEIIVSFSEGFEHVYHTEQDWKELKNV